MRNKLLTGALLASFCLPAAAHVTLMEKTAKPGAAYIAHLRVGHGCNGSPTIALRVEIPDGVSDVVPQPAPGWTLQTEQSAGRVKAVTWSGASLAANQPGVFAIAMTLPSASGMLAFPVTQSCQNAVEQWSQMPAPDGHPLKNPAPILTVSPTSAKTPDDAMGGMKM